MDQVTARRTGTARLLAVLAVLVGMFLMHGAPTSAMGGCHDALTLTLPAAAHPMAAANPMDAAHPAAQVQGQSAAGTDAMSGLCLSTGTRDHQFLASPALAALTALVLFTGLLGPGTPRQAGRAGRRGPPGGGRQILLRVCIART
ncbi:hypothetical protein [Streptacidiphilus cavernicola]|uniref:Uncharacterized protein n=1 Tax=Streptacidiphilus cavernicola TaxID=3342716 RepID=A0ABV6VVE1_9ACTN